MNMVISILIYKLAFRFNQIYIRTTHETSNKLIVNSPHEVEYIKLVHYNYHVIAVAFIGY